jgi:hypothetical protein
MHFLKLKNHLVVKLFIVVLSFCALSLLSSPAYAYQDSDSSQALNVIEDESIPEPLDEIALALMEEIFPKDYDWYTADCAWIYIIASIIHNFYQFDPTNWILDIIHDYLWAVWNLCENMD